MTTDDEQRPDQTLRADPIATALASLADAPIAVAQVGPGATVQVCTDAFAGIVGHPRSRLEGRSLAEVCCPDDRSLLDQLVAGELAGEVRLSGRRSDALPFSILAHWRAGLLAIRASSPPLYRPNAPVEPTLVRSALGGIDSALSHDVRGTLRGVNSFLELVARSEALAADEKADRFLGIARSAGSDADVMVEKLVHYLRIRERPLMVDDVALEGLVAPATKASLDDFSPEGAEPEPSVVVDGPLPPVVGNPELLTECLSELITNARKFGGGTLHVAATVDDGWVRLTLTDSGPGIPPELTEDAFRLFRLLQAKGRVPGVGMGLALCRAIAEVHGGSLHLSAGPDGVGTVAALRLLGAELSQ